MNFDYSDEQRHLKSEARRFLDDKCPPAAARRVLDQPTSSFNRELWAQIGELGWLGTVIPATYGGLGLTHVELCALAEELGRAIAPVPLASTLYFFCEALLLLGSEEQKAQWLPRVADGKLIGCMASVEGAGQVASHRLSARVIGTRLTGTKIPVADGDVADCAVVLAQSDAGPSLFLVPLTGSGVTRERLESIDESRGLARLTFLNAKVEPLGVPGRGMASLERIFDRAAVLLAFEQLGGADRCLDLARDHALNRYTFGRPIGSYQAIKHRLADMYVKNELARAHCYHAAWALADDAEELDVAAAAARLAAGDAFGFAAQESIQVHGGMGVTWEGDSHLYLRRARHLSLIAGATACWAERLVTGVIRHAAVSATMK